MLLHFCHFCWTLSPFNNVFLTLFSNSPNLTLFNFIYFNLLFLKTFLNFSLLFLYFFKTFPLLPLLAVILATSLNNTLKNGVTRNKILIPRSLASNLRFDTGIVFSGSGLTCGDAFTNFLTSVFWESCQRFNGPSF